MTSIARERRVRPRAIVVWSLVALLLLLIAAAAWVGFRALQTKDELERIVPLADRLRSAAAERDLDMMQGVADELRDTAGRAAGSSGDPIWRAAEILPWIGDDLTAVRVASDELDSVATRAVSPLLGVIRELATPAGGSTLDLGAVQRAAEPVAIAAESLTAARDRLQQIDPQSLVPQLRDGVSILTAAVSNGADLVTGASDAVAILPGMLGADGPRTILLMLQNPAELRTGGGITGSFAQLTADGGSLTLTDQADSSDFPVRDEPILPIPEADTALYGDIVGRYVQNTSMTADFTLSANLASAWWQDRTGVRADAVLSIDPLVLRSLLAVAGPVALADGSELTADNLVDRLLVEPYLSLDQPGQSAFQQQVTSAVFSRLLSGPIDPLAWAEGLAEPIAAGRVSLWSADESEQAVLAASALAGPAARQRAAGSDAFAVYFNDRTGAKLDPFLDVTVSTAVAECREDGRRDVVVSVTLVSAAPAGAADLPPSVTGGGQFGIRPGDISTVVTVAAPTGTFLGGVTADGSPAESSDVEGDVPSAAATTTLAPGQSSTLQFRFTAAAPGPVDPIILHTPLIEPVTVEAIETTCG